MGLPANIERHGNEWCGGWFVSYLAGRLCQIRILPAYERLREHELDTGRLIAEFSA